jgi:hypothetical protein
MDKQLSLHILICLIVAFAILSAINVLLLQGVAGAATPPATMPAPLPIIALISAGIVLVLYGAIGLIGFFLARKIGLPELWDSHITNRQRFLIPALIGAAVGVVLIIGDLIFSPINGIGHFPHPPFPISIVAALAAGIGEETVFRLFFISLWTWLVSKVILRGRFQPVVYWVVSVLAALAFGISHLPSILYLQNWTSMSQVPPALLAEILLLNGLMALAAAYYFRKFGFLAAVGVHFWADVIWHVIWGVL